jgi:glutaredoxin
LHSREEYVIYEIDISNKPEMKKLVVESLGTTVPQIVINGWHIGGYNDLERYLQ